MTSGTVSSLFFLLLCVSPSLAQTQQAQFNQVLNLNGDMQLNSFAFPDGSKIETFSQKQQQLIVNQQTPAVPANQVTGSTGSPFVALMQQSMTISTNGATNLVGGQIELAMNPQMLQAAGITPDNAFVAMLSPDRQTWMIQETVKTVNGTDNTVRMIKRVTMDGEYMALGRQTAVTGQALTPFGSDPTTQVNIVGSGLQENEFQDGFRTSVRAANPLTMNVNVKKGIDTSMLSALHGQTSVNDYRYSVVTSLNAVQPNLNQMVTVVQMPINAIRIQEMMQAMGIQGNGQVSLAVAQRTVLQNPGGATGQLAAPPPPPQRRGRDLFRNVVRQTGQTAQGQTAQGQTAQGQTPQQAQTPQGQTPQQAQTPQQGTPTNPQPVAQTLLLSPTFTPVQAQAVLDPVNMRIAIPVRQIDGEFILTMARAGEAQAAAPQPQQPQGQTPQGQTPQGERPAAPQEPQGGNSTRPEGARPSGEPTPAGEPKPTESKAGEPKPAEPKPERRQEKAPTGAILMTMNEINKMVELQKWGGQAPISQMMNDYVKSQSGK